MKTLVVLEGNCGSEGKQFKTWLEKNLPEDIQLDFRENCEGVGGGLFDENWNEIDKNTWDRDYWNDYCNSIIVPTSL